MKHKVFVYGTLRRGEEVTHRLPGFQMFKCRGKHFDFPYIQPCTCGNELHNIYGNIIEVDDIQLEELDKYENVKSLLFTRERAIVYPMTETIPEEVWVYVAGPALANKPIPTGLWES